MGHCARARRGGVLMATGARGKREKNKPVIGRWKWREKRSAETFYFARLKLFFIVSSPGRIGVGAISEGKAKFDLLSFSLANFCARIHQQSPLDLFVFFPPSQAKRLLEVNVSKLTLQSRHRRCVMGNVCTLRGRATSSNRVILGFFRFGL